MQWKIGQLAWTGKHMLSLVRIIRYDTPPNYAGAQTVLAEFVYDFREYKAGDRGYFIASELLRPILPKVRQ